MGSEPLDELSGFCSEDGRCAIRDIVAESMQADLNVYTLLALSVQVVFLMRLLALLLLGVVASLVMREGSVPV